MGQASDQSDDNSPDGLGGNVQIAKLLLFNEATGLYERWRSGTDSADALAISGAKGGHASVLAHQLLFNGASWDRMRGPTKFIPLNAVSVNTEATLWTPAAGKKFRLMGWCVSQGTAAGNIVLKDNTGGATIITIPKHTLDVALFVSLGNGILSAAANNVLTGTGVATETVSGFLFGTEE